MVRLSWRTYSPIDVSETSMRTIIEFSQCEEVVFQCLYLLSCLLVGVVAALDQHQLKVSGCYSLYGRLWTGICKSVEDGDRPEGGGPLRGAMEAVGRYR